MEIYKPTIKQKLIIICCMHGDERFGLVVFDFLKKRIKKYPRLKLLIANTNAVSLNKRFIDKDLNESFPGNLFGNYEQRLACKIKEKISNSRFVIDIHTTTSNITMTPIFTKDNKRVRKILNLTKSKEFVFVQEPFSNTSLINIVHGGVSLEFNEQYARTPDALREIVNIVECLINEKANPVQKREIYFVDRNIPKNIKIPSDAKNFKYLKAINGYPFLIHEKSNIHTHGMLALKKINDFI